MATEQTGKIAISEGAEVYGSDGKHWGRIEAVGAKYLTIAEGLLGAKQWHLPIGFVACGDTDRVELTVPLVDAKARATQEEPPDEPIYGESAPIAEEEREAVGIVEPVRAEVGTGEDREETARVREAERR